MLREYQEQQKLEREMSGNPLTDDDLVFSNFEEKPFCPSTITRAWATLAAKCGLKVIRFHDARHTHASLMLKQGIHPKVVQERLGHASIQMTLDLIPRFRRQTRQIRRSVDSECHFERGGGGNIITSGSITLSVIGHQFLKLNYL